jgi:transcription antitermination factor NusG
VHRWSDRRKVIQVPLFPGYTFVRVTATPQAYLQVLNTTGVVSFVGNGRGGIPIPDKHIEDIQTVLAHNLLCALPTQSRSSSNIASLGHNNVR